LEFVFFATFKFDDGITGSSTQGFMSLVDADLAGFERFAGPIQPLLMFARKKLNLLAVLARRFLRGLFENPLLGRGPGVKIALEFGFTGGKILDNRP
jgi:hypothetical protein